MPNPEIAGLPAEAYEVIGEKVTHRLAQRPGSYVVLKYVRPLVKRQGHRGPVLSPGPGGRAGGRARRCQLPRRPGRRQVPLPPAAVPPAPAPAGRRHRGQPPVADPAGPGRGAAAGPHRRGPCSRPSAPAGSRRWTRPRSRPGARVRASSRPGTSGRSGATPTTGAAARSSFSTDPRVRPSMCARGSGTAGARHGAAHRRLRGLCPVRRAHRHRPRPVLDTHPTHLRAGQGHRAGGQRRGAGAHRRPLPHRGRDPRRRA